MKCFLCETPLARKHFHNFMNKDAHATPYSIHPRGTKMYNDLKRHFWWPGMKKDVARFVGECLTCQQVKSEHQRPAGLLKPMPIPELKWEHITMYFVVGYPGRRKVTIRFG